MRQFWVPTRTLRLRTYERRFATRLRLSANGRSRLSVGVEVARDNALSPAVAKALTDAGHDALHVPDIAMQAASDGENFDRAAVEDEIVISADTDFGTLLGRAEEQHPPQCQIFVGIHRSAPPGGPTICEQGSPLHLRLPEIRMGGGQPGTSGGIVRRLRSPARSLLGRRAPVLPGFGYSGQ